MEYMLYNFYFSKIEGNKVPMGTIFMYELKIQPKDLELGISLLLFFYLLGNG